MTKQEIRDRWHMANVVARKEGERFRAVKNRFGSNNALLTSAELDLLAVNHRGRVYIEEPTGELLLYQAKD